MASKVLKKVGQRREDNTTLRITRVPAFNGMGAVSGLLPRLAARHGCGAKLQALSRVKPLSAGAEYLNVGAAANEKRFEEELRSIAEWVVVCSPHHAIKMSIQLKVRCGSLTLLGNHLLISIFPVRPF